MASRAGVSLTSIVAEVGITLKDLDVKISNENLLKVPLFLLEWRTVAPYLGLDEVDVEDIERDGKKEADKRLKMLQCWKSKFAFRATYEKLAKAFLTVGRADDAEKVCRLLTCM